MDALRHLGEALAALRTLGGSTAAELATREGISLAVLADAERGVAAEDVGAKLAAAHGIELADGMASAIEDDCALSVFLLHGPYQDFDAYDLREFARAVDAGRQYLISGGSKATEGLARRLQFSALPAGGPLARDAARQGYKLAQHVRERLNLGVEPLPDVRELVEDRLGLIVLVSELQSDGLRAASILDAGRFGAAIVLAAAEPSRERNALLSRVYIAHELAHLLFDPVRPGCVQIALDDTAERGASSPSRLESRAKGFAAELLIPQAGAQKLVGPLRADQSLKAARERVVAAASHFSTPWEIACRHLENVGLIAKGFASELIHDGRPDHVPAAGPTSLPAKGEPPICLIRSQEIVPPSSSDSVRRSRAVGARTVKSMIADLLEQAYEHARGGRPIAATDLLVDHFDAWLSAGDLDRVLAAVECLDPQKLPPQVLTGVLSTTRPAKVHLGDAYGAFVSRTLVALETTWSVTEERRNRIAARLR